MGWRKYQIEKYGTGWNSQSFPNWIIKDEDGAEIYRSERASSGLLGGIKWHLFQQPADYKKPTATIQSSWWGKWEIASPENVSIATVSPQWFGNTCSFEYGNAKFRWLPESKLLDSNDNVMASIEWHDSGNECLNVSELGDQMLGVVVATAVAVKCYWAQVQETNRRMIEERMAEQNQNNTTSQTPWDQSATNQAPLNEGAQMPWNPAGFKYNAGDCSYRP